MNGTMAHGPLPSQSLLLSKQTRSFTWTTMWRHIQGVSKPETQKRKVDDRTGYFKQYDIKRARSFNTKWREPGCDRRHLVVVCNLCIDQPWLMIVTGSHRLRPHLNHSTLYVKNFQTVNNLLAYKITQNRASKINTAIISKYVVEMCYKCLRKLGNSV